MISLSETVTIKTAANRQRFTAEIVFESNIIAVVISNDGDGARFDAAFITLSVVTY